MSKIRLKSPHDIEHLAEGGRILATILDELEEKAIAGALPTELDAYARQRIAEHGCTPSFLNYAPKGHAPFPAALCLSVNHAIVHGLPNSTPLKDGDVVGLDLGLVYQNKYYLDSARTVIVGTDTQGAAKLVAVTKESLNRGIEAAKPGNTLGDIGHAIQSHVEAAGFSIVTQLVGHGVGFAVHESPQVPNFGNPGTGEKIKPGLVIAIEPMVTIGDPAVTTGSDGWTVEIQTGALSAHQEHTVAVTVDGPRVLTTATE